MDTYIVRVWCDRQGIEVEEEVNPTVSMVNDDWKDYRKKLMTLAEEQHGGQCGTKREPCMTEANSFEVGEKICPDCDRVLPEEYTRCWSCENKHGREVG